MRRIYHGSMKRGNQMVGQIDRLQLNAIQRWWNWAWVSRSAHSRTGISRTNEWNSNFPLSLVFVLPDRGRFIMFYHKKTPHKSHCKQAIRRDAFLTHALNVSENGNEKETRKKWMKGFLYFLYLASNRCLTIIQQTEKYWYVEEFQAFNSHEMF